jgi:hypothetical protein
MTTKIKCKLRPLSSILYGLIAVSLFFNYEALASDIADYPLPSTATASLEAIDVNSLKMTLDFPELPLQYVQNGNDNRVWLEIENEGSTDEPGKATLPLITRFIAIPPNAVLHADILDNDIRVIEHVKIVPVASDGQDALSSDWVDNQSWLSADTPYPRQIVTVGHGVRLRNLWLVPVTIAPARYYPQDQRLEISRHLDIRMNLEGGTFRDPSIIQGKLVESFDRIYRGIVANYDLLELDQQPIRGTYLIICPNDTSVINNLQDLLIWKNREGYRAVLATTAQTGATTTSIRDYIRNAYYTWEYPPEFVCLVGDANGTIAIPTDASQFDHFYSLMDNDVLPDLAVGRLSCDNVTTLQTIVNKIMHYEKEPYMAQTDWYQRAIMIAGSSSSGISTIYTKRSVRWRLLQHGYTQVDTMWYTMGGSIVTAIANAFNHGIGILNHRGYIGMSGWSNTNTNNLSNGYMLPIVLVIESGSGTFNSGTSLSEGFLRAGSPTTPKGGIASIGVATTSDHTKYNNCFDVGFFAGMFDVGLPHMGEALMYGKTEVRRNYPSGQGDSHIYWYNLMGDPGLVVWKQIPLPLTTTYEDTIPLGANAFTIHVVDQNQQPLEDAYACLWQQNGTLYQVGYTNASGNVELNCGAAHLGSFFVTITKEGFIPHLGQTAVVTMAQALGISSAPLDDDSTGSSHGNGDGNWNPSEQVEIRPILRNLGTQQIQNIQATLQSEDNLISIIQGTGSFGSILPGDSAQISSAFVVSLDSKTPNGHLCRLMMNLQGTGYSQQLFLDYQAVSYQLQLLKISVSDGGNNFLEPGETVNLLMILQNNGGFSGNGLTAVLRGDPNYVQVIDSIATFGSIAIGSFANNNGDPFSVHAFPTVLPGIKVPFTMLTTSTEGIIDTVFASVRIRVADPHGAPLGPDQYGYFCFDNTDTAYGQAPIFSWVEIDSLVGGPGTLVPLTDFGNEQDDSRMVMLPFTFQYYGDSYDRITVCSNGWLAMGDQSYFQNFRNWIIPSPLGPPAMIAPFWDDLILTSGTGGGKVYYWFDTSNHRFIVEWSRTHTYNGTTETFEVILYDPISYPTPTGDGEILFQYRQVLNVTGVGSDNNYATVGIENFNQSDGIQYTWMNNYPAEAAALVKGRAIKFTTNTGQPVSTLQCTNNPSFPEPLLTQNSEMAIPDYFLAQNYPNPFNPKTTIRFGLPEPSLAKIVIFNILGQVVAVPVNEYLEAGYHQTTFETTELTSGVYFFSISTPKYTSTRKMVLLR